ncbi:hypothetical protein MMC30_001450 [Trapelia coarctata]|nr:hypothetical protein [Trapelia coarctata]
MRTRSSQTGASRRQSGQGRISYRESSSEGSAFESEDEVYREPPKLRKDSRVLKASTPVVSTKKRKSSRCKPSREPVMKKTKPDSTPDSGGELDKTFATHPIKLMKSMPWHTLPYDILLQIFQYASQPLCDNLFQATPSVTWLLRAALVCKSFAEPALSALYYAPPLAPPARARGLLSHLAAQGETSTLNYRNKVRYLEIEATSILLQKSDGREPLSLQQLVQLTPQLRGIGIHLLSDQPQYRSQLHLMRKRPGAVYKKQMFEALIQTKILLLTWKWNFKFNRSVLTQSSYPWKTLKDIHLQVSFQSLRTLAIVRFDSMTSIEEHKLAEAIGALPSLKRLSLDSCSFPKGKLLSLLPRELESLQITAWLELTSDMLHPFLLTHGSNLRALILDHNQSLNIAFLVDLAEACPLLEVFKMDMTFYSSFATFFDSEPKFGTLLLPGALPTWPSTLQTIELLHLRKWYSTSAEMFIGSLVDSAPTLLQLRRLILKTSIEIGWRDRASFRGRWIGKLRKVFLRRSPPPALSAPLKVAIFDKKLKEASTKSPDNEDSAPRRSGLRQRGSRRLSHVEIPKDVVGTESDSDAPIVPRAMRRSNRLMEQEADDSYGAASGSVSLARRSKDRPSRLASQSTEGDTESQTAEGGNEDEDLFIQGLCDVVDIRIDNLRPAQMQYSENDFLDDEVSGDEEWNGDDGIVADGGYAW